MPAKEGNFLKFLGTAGARFVMIRQLRSSGGIWISVAGKNILIDPGPGSIVHCNKSRPRLDPSRLDAIILTHRHLDHSGDINVMIEAMTEGGFKKKGILFSPADALDNDPVILKHAQNLLQKIEILKEKSTYKIGEFVFHTSMQHIHPVETYGIKFKIDDTSIALLTDTKYFPELVNFYSTNILIISVVFYQPREEIQHLSLFDAEQIIRQVNPKKAILTHFGMTMLKAKPYLLARKLTDELGIEVVAAYDGLTLTF